MAKATMVYDSVEEAMNRLAGTIVTYEGRPVRIEAIETHADGILRVLFWEFPFNRGDLVRKKINSPHFKRFVTPPLGYCNYFGAGAHAVWCERLPARTRRQGLSEEVINVVTDNGQRVGFNRLSTSDAFREMVVGEYPEFSEALRRLVPDSSIAVDRDFVLNQAPDGFTKLVWRREPIALVLRGEVLLRGDRQHMIETIAENPRLPNRVEVI